MNGSASDQDFNKGPLTMALRQYICEYTLSEYLKNKILHTNNKHLQKN